MKVNIKVMLVVLFLAAGFIHLAEAHPPTDIQLDYDFEKQLLHVEMRHTTHDPREDLIRKLIVTKNKEEPIVKYYNIQTNTLQFSDDILLSAKDGDLILIDAYSKEGGRAQKEIIVKENSDEDKQKDVLKPLLREKMKKY